MEKAFNLLNEPWIVVQDDNGRQEVSLLQAFRCAHRYRALAGELPTQDVAVLRLMLAAMYGAIANELDPMQDPADLWHTLFAKGKFDENFVNAYLQKWHEQFWLVHPTAPFFQVAGLATTSSAEKDVSQMIADVPSRQERRFFSNQSGSSLESLTFSQTARWLVHLQAWDYAGKKASVIGGSPNGGGTGWCGKLGILYAAGNTLFETLMYNFILADNEGLITIASPVWECPPKTAAKVAVLPKSYVELLTWQSRRALLQTNGGQVTGVIASYGDVFDKENHQNKELMSGWHVSSVKGQGYIPTTHNPSRNLWRDLDSLLPYAFNAQTENVKCPEVINWLSDSLQIPEVVRLCSVGYEFGAMMGVVNTLISDNLTINASLFGALGKEYAIGIADQLSATDAGVKALGNLANDLALAAGYRDSKASINAQEQAYYELDEPFRRWVAAINPDDDGWDAAITTWQKTAAGLLKKIAAKLADEAGEQAFVGRTIEKNKKTYQINTTLALRNFYINLHKSLN